jgi:3-oxoadipate enol-lactonase
VLAYDVTGGGSAVVLLHAGIADRRMWTPMAGLLPFRVVTCDLQGYGESSPSPDSFAHHDQVVELLDHLEIERATLVGCSFGGLVAIDTALAHPDRVSALVLLGSALGGYQWTERRALWDQLIGPVDEDDLGAMAAAEVRFWVVGPDRQPADVDPALIAFAEEMDRTALAAEGVLDELDVRDLDPPAVDRLGEISCPTLVLVGASDIPEIGTIADRLVAGIPGARRLPDVPDAGHLLPLEHPEPVAAAVTAFLTDL